MNRQINTRQSILAFLLGLFVTTSVLMTPAVTMLAAHDGSVAPDATTDLLAGGERDPDYG